MDAMNQSNRQRHQRYWATFMAISQREMVKFWYQRGRLLSALVRPALWLIVFAAGFQNVFGVSIIPPYETYIEYQVYVVPGLLGMVMLFNGMQSSLAMVYDREMGFIRFGSWRSRAPRWCISWRVSIHLRMRLN